MNFDPELYLDKLIHTGKQVGAAEERVKGLEWFKEQNRVLWDINQVKDAEIGKKAARILELEKAQREWRQEEDAMVTALRLLVEQAGRLARSHRPKGWRAGLNEALDRANRLLEAYIPF